MRLHIPGIIRGKQIELEHETELPSGSPVLVNIRPRPLSLKEKEGLVSQLCGSWAGDPSLTPIFEEIQEQRRLNQARNVDFDAAP